MTKAIPFYWFREKDYDCIRDLIPNDSHLPASFGQWEQANKQVAQIEACGATIRRVVVEPQQFAAYCKRRGIDHSIAALGAFVLDIELRDDDSGTS